MAGAENKVLQAEQEHETGEDEQCRLRKFTTWKLPSLKTTPQLTATPAKQKIKKYEKPNL